MNKSYYHRPKTEDIGAYQRLSLFMFYINTELTNVQIKAAQRLQLAFTRQDREKMHSLLNLREQGARGVNVE